MPQLNTPDDLFEKGLQAYQSGDPDQAFRLFLDAAEQGHLAAMYNVSISWHSGIGTFIDEGRSAEWMLRCAEAGYPLAYAAMSEKFYFGIGVSQDFRQALYWTRKALEADPGNQNHINNIQYLEKEIASQEQNGGVAPNDLLNRGFSYYQAGNYDNAFRFFMEAASAGLPAAMNNVGVCYANGQGVAADQVQAFNWMKKAAEGGYAPACHILGQKYLQGHGTKVDLQQAFLWTKKAVELDPSNEQYGSDLENIRQLSEHENAHLLNTGLERYKSGRYEEAFQLFLQAAERGFVPAMNNVSVMYANGQGVAADQVQAFQWMKRAAEGGNASACATLSVKYHNGTGTEKDMKKALYWMQKAVQLDPDNASYKHDLQLTQSKLRQAEQTDVKILLTPESDPEVIKTLVAEGEVLRSQRRFAEALTKFVPAGKAGHYKALRYIAEIYYSGDGVEQNYNHSVAFYTAAAYRGDPVSRDALALRFNFTENTAPWKVIAYLNNTPNTADMLDRLNFAVGAQQTSNSIRMENEYRHHDMGLNNAFNVMDGFQKGCAAGYPDAFAALAYRFKKDYRYHEKSLSLMKRAALLGQSQALYELGMYYSTRNRSAAQKCFKEAAKRGHKMASYQL